MNNKYEITDRASQKQQPVSVEVIHSSPSVKREVDQFRLWSGVGLMLLAVHLLPMLLAARGELSLWMFGVQLINVLLLSLGTYLWGGEIKK